MNILHRLMEIMGPILHAVAYYAGLLCPLFAGFVFIAAWREFRRDRRQSFFAPGGDSNAAHYFQELRAVFFAESAVVVLLMLVGFGLSVSALGLGSAVAFVLGACLTLALAITAFSGRAGLSFDMAEAAVEDKSTDKYLKVLGVGQNLTLMLLSAAAAGLGGLFYFFRSVDSVPNIAGFCVGSSLTVLICCVGGGVIFNAYAVNIRGQNEEEAARPGAGRIFQIVSKSIGESAGVTVDLFESYVGTILATIIIASTLAPDMLTELAASSGTALQESFIRQGLMGFPFVLALLGMGSTMAGKWVMQRTPSISLTGRFRRVFVIETLFFWIGLLIFVIVFSPLRTLLAAAVIAGSFLGAALVVCAEFVNPQFFSFFSLRPSDMSADPAARFVIAGLRGIALPLLALGVMIIVANNCSGLYGVCLAANGLLLTVVHGLCARSTTADAEDTGPAASRDPDNSPAGRTDMLRRGGWKVPTTMCSALAGFVLFAAYTVVVSGGVDVNIVEADCLVGIFFGVATAALFASLVISAFVRAASSAAADPASLVRSAFHELVVPGLVALLVPLLVALLGTQSLGGMVAGVIIGSFLLALFVGALGGEMETSFMGTDAQSESSQNMTVGVMLVDTVPPAMNVLAKLIAGFALVLAPVL